MGTLALLAILLIAGTVFPALLLEADYLAGQLLAGEEPEEPPHYPSP